MTIETAIEKLCEVRDYLKGPSSPHDEWTPDAIEKIKEAIDLLLPF